MQFQGMFAKYEKAQIMKRYRRGKVHRTLIWGMLRNPGLRRPRGVRQDHGRARIPRPEPGRPTARPLRPKGVQRRRPAA
jgi:hypothetical protein